MIYETSRMVQASHALFLPHRSVTEHGEQLIPAKTEPAMNVCTLYQPGLLEMPAFWVALGAAVFLASFSIKRSPAPETDQAETA